MKYKESETVELKRSTSELCDFFSGKERSVLRNPLIANTLYLSKDIERWGSGIKRIHDACLEENVKVSFDKLKSGFLVTFYRKGTALHVQPEPSRDQVGTQLATQSATQSTDPVIRLLHALYMKELSAGELRSILIIKHRPTFRANYLHPALKSGFIEYTISDKPNSRLQKYRLTKKGAKYLKRQEKKGSNLR